MSRCYDCAEVEGYCTCIEQRVREHIAQEIESYTPFFATRKKMAEQGWPYAVEHVIEVAAHIARTSPIK